ncbi:serine protease inhibitor 27A-like [Drosophila mojavensis]|uniref:serine protease inhibitor 27A-like n=1 Tax=Drosophila mojavensis TaxID=7230 RepID=UPI001CD04E59|nr:serine protease inhibitor 27A-like [Drosophila mojavensis]
MANDGYYNYKYVEKLDADALEIPYMNSKISMLILLPRTTNGFVGIQNNLHMVALKDISATESRAFHVEFPKFNLDFQRSFTDIFKSVGIVEIFQNSANISSISQTPLRVSEVFQKVTIEVRENGTEASAAQESSVTFVPAVDIEEHHRVPCLSSPTS